VKNVPVTNTFNRTCWCVTEAVNPSHWSQ